MYHWRKLKISGLLCSQTSFEIVSNGFRSTPKFSIKHGQNSALLHHEPPSSVFFSSESCFSSPISQFLFPNLTFRAIYAPCLKSKIQGTESLCEEEFFLRKFRSPDGAFKMIHRQNSRVYEFPFRSSEIGKRDNRREMSLPGVVMSLIYGKPYGDSAWKD